MSNSSDITAVTGDGALRVDPILKELEPWLSARAKEVFTHVRTETSAEMFFFGRNYVGTSETRYQDFASRLSRLCDAFDGVNAYVWTDGSIVRPKIASCICSPLAIPLATAPHGELKVMFNSYLFVEGLPVTSWSTTECSPGNYNERRLWLNSLVGKFLPAFEEGVLPVNPDEVG